VTDLLAPPSTFQLLEIGFLLETELPHRFFVRLFRILVQLNSIRILRTLATHNLLFVLQKGIASPIDFIRRDTRSLFQLLVHSEAALALRVQFITLSPSAIVSVYKEASPEFTKMVLRIITLFRRVDTARDYGYLPFGQVKLFLRDLAHDFSNPRYMDLLCCLLQLCVSQDVVFCHRLNERKEVLNHFFQMHTASLLADCTATKLRCQKILFQIRFLEPSCVANPDLWNLILSEIISRQDYPKKREQAWKAFRNAVLNQPRIVAFLTSNPELAKKLNECFSSLDEKVWWLMLRMLPSFARPLTTINDKSDRQNLIDLWTKLAEPSVLIAGKIRSGFKGSMNNSAPTALRRAVIDFMMCLWDAPKDAFRKTGGPVLEAFISAPHILSELTEVMNEVAKSFGKATF
jgi:hypothetical protein